MRTMESKYSYLSALTENIARRQQSSIKSLEKLCHSTNMVSSDISNLINDLQMIGNIQFAENRINDEDITSATTTSESYSQQKDLTSPDPNEQRATQNLNLSSILLRAFELVPVDTVKEAIDSECHLNEQMQSMSTSIDDISGIANAANSVDDAIAVDIGIEALQDVDKATASSNYQRADVGKVAKLLDDLKVDVSVRNSNRETNVEDLEANQQESCSQAVHDDQQNENFDARVKKNVEPMNKDRVANILKRYSLYDDDDDDEEEEEDDDNES